MSWVVATNDISPVEARLGRSSVEGSRKRPDGSELKWKQIGVLGTIEDSQLPFFIQWLSSDHPSSDGKANSQISKIEISGDEKTIESWLGSNPKGAFKDVEVIYRDPSNSDETGIISVTISTPSGHVVLD
jgi:hypothetical protein